MQNTESNSLLASAPARGGRFRSIRERRGETQEAFAQSLTRLAGELGMPVDYDGQGISTRETGRRALDIEDYLLAVRLDPDRRSLIWLALGRDLAEQVTPKLGLGKAADAPVKGRKKA